MRRFAVAFALAAAAAVVPGVAAAKVFTVDLIARDNANPNGVKFAAPDCATPARYPFAFPAGARKPRLYEDFRAGLFIAGPDAAGGEDGPDANAQYAQITAITPRTDGERTVFDFEIRGTAGNCESGWRTLPVQVFGYYQRRTTLHVVDAAGKRRSAPPRAFAIGRGQVVRGIRWSDWGRQEAEGRGRLGRVGYAIAAYNPEYCRGRVYYTDYLVTAPGVREFFDLSRNCRRLIRQE